MIAPIFLLTNGTPLSVLYREVVFTGLGKGKTFLFPVACAFSLLATYSNTLRLWAGGVLQKCGNRQQAVWKVDLHPPNEKYQASQLGI